MIKTNRVKLKLNKAQFDLVREKQIECANCWNDIVAISKEYYLENKKWIDKYDIQKIVKGKYNLHSQTIQAITDKFDANRKTISELRKNGDKKAKYPYKTKKFYVIPLKNSAINTNSKGNLKLTMSKGRYLELDFNIPNIKTAEIVWRNGYYLFEKQPLEIVFKKLSRYYGVQIEWDEIVGKLTCSGKLDLRDNLNDVLDNLKNAASIQIVYSGEKIKISTNS